MNSKKSILYAGTYQLPSTIADLEAYVRDIDCYETAEKEFVAHHNTRNWRVHIKLLCWDLLNGNIPDHLAQYWFWLDMGSQVTPQLLLVLALFDNNFSEKATKKNNDGFYFTTKFSSSGLAINKKALAVLSCLVVNGVKFEITNIEKEYIAIQRKILVQWASDIKNLELLKGVKNINEVEFKNDISDQNFLPQPN